MSAAGRPSPSGLQRQAKFAAPIIQICARRGLCSHAPIGVQFGGYGALAN